MTIILTVFQGDRQQVTPASVAKLSWGGLAQHYATLCHEASGGPYEKGSKGFGVFASFRKSTDADLATIDAMRERSGNRPLATGVRSLAKQRGYRKADHVEEVTAIGIDYDGEERTPPNWSDDAWPCELIAHSTHNYDAETRPGKWRAILRLDSPMPQSAYRLVRQALSRQLPRGAIVRSSVQPAFFPTCPEGGSVKFLRCGVGALDWRAMLAEEERRVAERPQASKALTGDYKPAEGYPPALVQALAEVWPSDESGQGRHEAALALGGVLAESEWDDESVLDFCRMIFEAKGTSHGMNEVSASLYTRRNGDGSEMVLGWPKLIDCMKGPRGGKLHKAAADKVVDLMRALIPGLQRSVEVAQSQEVVQKEEEKAAKKEAARNSAQEGGRTVLPDLAHRTIVDYLLATSLADLVKCYGRLWRPNDQNVWEEYTEWHTCQETSRLRDEEKVCAVNAQGELSTLHLSYNTETSIHNMVLRMLPETTEFFEKAPWGCAFRNGVFAGADGFTTLTKDHRVRNLAPVDYDPECGAPDEVIRTMGQWFEGCEDKGERMRFLLEHLGITLLGATNAVAGFGKAAILVGSGANGKSVWMKTVAKLLPKGATCAIQPKEMADERYRTRLSSATANLVGEIDPTGIKSASAMKAVITGEEVFGRYLHKEVFEFVPRCSHMFGCNELPNTPDHTDGWWRRWIIIEFPNKFEGADVDYNLEEKLGTQANLNALAAAAVLVAYDAINNGRGYTEPKDSDDQKEDWKEEGDTVLEFVEARGLKADDELPNAERATSTQVYKAFVRWLEKEWPKATPLSQKRFSHRLVGLGFKKKKTNMGLQFNLKLPSAPVYGLPRR